MVKQAAGIAASLEAYSDRLTDEDQALVTLVKGLAEAVDESPGNAALWKEYRAAVATLSEVMARGDDDDTTAWRLSIQAPSGAKVGNPPKS